MSTRKQQHKQYNATLYRLVLWIVLSMAIVPCPAQQNDGDDKEFKAEDFGFNALEVNQHRFIQGDKEPYENKRFLDHFSLGAGARFDNIKPLTTVPFLMSHGSYLFAEKEISRLQSLQLGFSWSIYEKDHSKHLMNKSHFELAHYFNWTRFFLGYNPERPLHIATSARVGVFNAKYLTDTQRGMTAALGARASLMLNPSIFLQVEPYLAAASDKIDFSGDNNFHRYDVTYGVTASLSYLLGGNRYATAMHDKDAQRFFIDYSLGGQLALNTPLPMKQTLGPAAGLGVGYWLDQHFGFRLKGNLSKNVWRELYRAPQHEDGHPAYYKQFSNLLSCGHLDLMVNLNSYIAAAQELPIDVNLLAGWQFGWITKHDVDPDEVDDDLYDDAYVNTLLSCNNNGFSMGMQLRWAANDEMTLYVEPRLTFAGYKIPYLPPYSHIVERYSDTYLNLSIGAELGGKPRKQRNVNVDDDVDDDDNQRLTFGLNGGPALTIHNKAYKGIPFSEYMGGAHVSYRLGAHGGVRAAVDIAQTTSNDIHPYHDYMLGNPYLYDGLWHSSYTRVNLSTEYLCDLTSLLNGYHSSRRLSMLAGIGPVVSYLTEEQAIIDQGELIFNEQPPILLRESKAAPLTVGAQLGMTLHYRIGKHIGAYIEERLRLYGKQFVADQHVGNMTKIISTQIGLTYTL